MSLSFAAFASCSDDDKDESTNSNGNTQTENDNGSNNNSGSQTAVIVGTENGHEWVDLGLTSGTKWATCNVGADKPEEYGNYYAWGEVTTKSTYASDNYKFGYDYGQLTKYCSNSSYGKDGFTDNKTTLELSDDAAYVNWGGKWRMPTKAQQDELRNECYLVWTENYNGSNVEGYIVYKAKTSSDKGNVVSLYDTPSSSYSLSDAHIFLPAAGRYEENLCGVGSGYYWSSSLNTEYPNSAWLINFDYDGVYDSYYYGRDWRNWAPSVRAVIPGE